MTYNNNKKSFLTTSLVFLLKILSVCVLISNKVFFFPLLNRRLHSLFFLCFWFSQGTRRKQKIFLLNSFYQNKNTNNKTKKKKSEKNPKKYQKNKKNTKKKVLPLRFCTFFYSPNIFLVFSLQKKKIFCHLQFNKKDFLILLFFPICVSMIGLLRHIQKKKAQQKHRSARKRKENNLKRRSK